MHVTLSLDTVTTVPRLSTEGHPLLCRLAASPCQCRSKTQLLTNVGYTSSQLCRLDHAGLGGQCIVPSTVNLGLTLHTGWTCQLTSDVMVKTPLQFSMTSLLCKQLAKFRTRLAAANRANLSVHAKIIYFNTFSLSLFYYSQTHRFFSPVLLKPLYRAMADFLLQRHWFPQHLLVGLCRWLRIGPLLDPAIMQAISLFGCYLRQGYRSLAEEPEGSYATQIQQCWRYWQTQLPAEDIQRLLALLRQDNMPAQRASRFKHLFKQIAITRLLEASHQHLTNRVYQNGWALGPSIEFLGWLAELPTTQVGAVPRYVLRWALGEDADFWLPLRGRLSRSQPCLWCQNNTRCFPQGPGYGAICPSCFQPAATRDITLHDLHDESYAFLQFHKITMPSLTRLPPVFSRLATSVGRRAPESYVPCVLCQRGVNSIDHWLSFCQVAHLTWIALWISPAPAIDWRKVPSRSTGVALCYLLFHLRRLVTEYGGLRPIIECVRNRSVSQHVLDLWQRVYRSRYQAPYFDTFVPRLKLVMPRVLTLLNLGCSASQLLCSNLPCSRPRGSLPYSPLSKVTQLPLLLKMTIVCGCCYCNTGSSLFLRLLLDWCPSYATVDPRICDFRLPMTCLPTLFSCLVNPTSGKVALFNLMALRISTLKRAEQALACFMSRRPPQP